MVQIMHCYWMLMTMKKGSGGGYSGYSDIDGSSQSFSPSVECMHQVVIMIMTIMIIMNYD